MLLLFVHYLHLTLKLKYEAMTKNFLLCHNQTILQHLFWVFCEINIDTEYFTCEKLDICIYGFAYMNKLGNQSIA